MSEQGTALTGRFAPSPTGPLHLGSLLAAVGSFLFARSRGARWLIRMEDLDQPRVVPGSADEILKALRNYGLQWDSEVVFQSNRNDLYEAAVQKLRDEGLAYDCACSRKDLAYAASAPLPLSDSAERIYPGTCRDGLPEGRAPRAVRFRAPVESIVFEDAIFGSIEESVADKTGDFVIRRADGPFAYQLAVVVDDAEQRVTEVVRGADLLSSTARQIALQRALGLPTPQYAHLPLVIDPDGAKLGKREGALPLPSLDPTRVVKTLLSALRILGFDPAGTDPQAILEDAVARFDPRRIPRDPYVVVDSIR